MIDQDILELEDGRKSCLRVRLLTDAATILPIYEGMKVVIDNGTYHQAYIATISSILESTEDVTQAINASIDNMTFNASLLGELQKYLRP